MMEIPIWLVYLIGVPLALVVAVCTFLLLACGFLFLKHFPSSPFRK